MISKNNKVKDSTLAKCAFHGVLFRGFSNTEKRISQKPLAGSATAEQKNADFYSTFFEDNGGYAAFASVVNSSRRVVKVGKQYKVCSVVTVQKEALQKDLEKAGIIKGLGAGF